MEFRIYAALFAHEGNRHCEAENRKRGGRCQHDYSQICIIYGHICTKELISLRSLHSGTLNRDNYVVGKESQSGCKDS
jgi:hypothetical protein